MGDRLWVMGKGLEVSGRARGLYVRVYDSGFMVTRSGLGG